MLKPLLAIPYCYTTMWIRASGRSWSARTTLFLLALFLVGPAAQSEPREIDLQLGYSTGVFGGANPDDAGIAIEMWLSESSKRIGVVYKLTTNFYNDIASMGRAFLDGRLDVVVLHSFDFVELREMAPVEGRVMGIRKGENANTYVLLANSDKQLKSIADLQGKQILVDVGQSKSAPKAWLDLRLNEISAPPTQVFFSDTKWLLKPSKVVLPVFFGRSDACLVRDIAYQTMVEMNPQINKTLKVIERTPDFCPGVVCVRSDIDDETKDLITQSVLSLRDDTKGRQLLLLFQVDDVIPYDPKAIEPMEEVMRKHRELIAPNLQ